MPGLRQRIQYLEKKIHRKDEVLAEHTPCNGPSEVILAVDKLADRNSRSKVQVIPVFSRVCAELPRSARMRLRSMEYNKQFDCGCGASPPSCPNGGASATRTEENT